MRKNVFISSTYLDLVEERKAIWELLQMFNVNIIGMEKFGARPIDSLTTCLEEVSNSDLFICILGIRYGSVDENTGKSFTKLEYEKAKELNKTILVYILEEHGSMVDLSLIDFDHWEELKRFKSDLRKNHTVYFFNNKESLIKSIRSTLMAILPESSIRKDYRPENLEADVHRFEEDNISWIIIVAYRFGEPFEIFINKHDGLYLPTWVERGWVIKATDDEIPRYDFRFMDSDGYKVTIEGLGNRGQLGIVQLLSFFLTKGIDIKIIREGLSMIDFQENAMKGIIDKAISVLMIKN